MRFAAECESCQARFDTGNRNRDRVAARRHAENEGHVVRAVTERATYYDGRRCPVDGCEFSPGHETEHPHATRVRGEQDYPLVRLREALRPFVQAYNDVGRMFCPAFSGPMCLAWFGNEGCKHHEEQEEVDEIVTLPYDRENPDTLPEGHTWVNIFYGGTQRAAKTGRRVIETRYVCEEPCSESCQCVGCWTEYHAPKIPGYIRDEDDDFDCTYCTFYFRPPNDGWRDLLAGMVREGSPGTDWTDFLGALNEPPVEPTTRPQRLAAQLVENLKAEAA